MARRSTGGFRRRGRRSCREPVYAPDGPSLGPHAEPGIRCGKPHDGQVWLLAVDSNHGSVLGLSADDKAGSSLRLLPVYAGAIRQWRDNKIGFRGTISGPADTPMSMPPLIPPGTPGVLGLVSSTAIPAPPT